MFVAKYAPDGTALVGHERGRRPTSDWAVASRRTPRQQLRDRPFPARRRLERARPTRPCSPPLAAATMFVAKYARTAPPVGQERGRGQRRPGRRHRDGPSRQQLRDRLFSGTATFGAGEANETVLTAAASVTCSWQSTPRNGTLLWATSAGGVGQDVGSGVATRPHGGAYVTGVFEGTATFGADEANETVLTPCWPPETSSWRSTVPDRPGAPLDLATHRRAVRLRPGAPAQCRPADRVFALRSGAADQ